MKKLFLLCSFIAFPSIGLAQSSIGFTHPDSIQVVLDYRLPDWGFSNFSINSGGFNTGFIAQDVTQIREDPPDNLVFTNNVKSDRVTLDVFLQPRYEYRRESEQQFLDFTSNTALSLQKSEEDRDLEGSVAGQTVANDELELELRNSDARFSQSVDLSVKQYVKDDFFVLAQLDAVVAFQERITDNTQDDEPSTDREVFNRDVLANPRIGIGWGRFRNVSPLIRAARLSERYQTLTGSGFSNNEILSAAEQFTRFEGYQRRYDRPLKYFWGDMDGILSGKLNGLGTFDTFYINDVFSEALGDRFEGLEVFAGFGYNYINRLIREDNRITGNLDRQTLFIRDTRIFANINWSKNLSLAHQISFVGVTERGYSDDDEAAFDRIHLTDLSFRWLWNIADRFFLNSFLRDEFVFINGNEDANRPSVDQNDLTIGTSLTYFIENSLSLTGNFSFNYLSSESDRDLQEDFNDVYRFNIGASVRYYFGRNLY